MIDEFPPIQRAPTDAEAAISRGDIAVASVERGAHRLCGPPPTLKALASILDIALAMKYAPNIDVIIPFNRRQLDAIEYLNHQGQQNRLLECSDDPIKLDDRVERRERLGGMLNLYHREAA